MDAERSSAGVIAAINANASYDSVVDVGCGTGLWLAGMLSAKSLDSWAGLDFLPYDRHLFSIDAEHYVQTDLNGDYSKSAPAQGYDLAVSMEVAEHIQPSNSRRFIRNLTQLSGQIVFSAAIPFQGGTGHINENWPEYWAALFREHDYFPVDCFRSALWENQGVCGWYSQNLLLYLRKDLLDARYPDYDERSVFPLSVIHPYLYLWNRTQNYPIAQQAYARCLDKYYAVAGTYRNGETPAGPDVGDPPDQDVAVLLDLVSEQLEQVKMELLYEKERTRKLREHLLRIGERVPDE